MLMRISRKWYLVAALSLCCFIALLGAISRQIHLRFADGGYVVIRPASLWGLVRSTTCEIRYYPGEGKPGDVALTANCANRPLIVAPADRKGVLLCLYDLEDMGLWLVKIDTTKAFDSESLTNHLNEIVRASSCKIERGERGDWFQVFEKLRGMTPDQYKAQALPDLDLGFVRFFRNKESLMPEVKGHTSPFSGL
jgi:hypothetical protein